MDKGKAVVFGGSGFLGSHVADVLDDRGYKVAIYDIKPSPYARVSQGMIVGDILDERKVQSTVKGADFVYNFAGVADIEEARRRPLDSVKSNILGNAIILEACRKFRIKRFVLASSLYVYSKAGSFYRSTKQAAESLVENYQEAYGLAYTTLRYGSLYGPRADDKNFMHRIITQALTEKKITRFGDGEELREYIHVQDAARGSVDILAKEFKNIPVILSGNQQIKVKDLLLMIREMLDNKIKIEFVPPRDNSHYEITPYSFAPKTARRLLSKTHLDLNQGILDMLYDLHGKIPVSKIGKRPQRKT